MAPTEATLLNNFLLPPASLDNIISVEAFTDLFPKSYRSSSHIQHLFLELQHVRDHTVDKVKHNIGKEIMKGERQRRQVAKAREQVTKGEAATIDPLVSGEQNMISEDDSILPDPRPYTISGILPDMEKACRRIEAEIAASEAETTSLIKDIENIVGGLSDLRYGRFSKAPGSDRDLREDVLDSLKGLHEACISSGSDEA